MVEQARSLDTTGDRIADARGLKAFSAGTFHLVFRVSLRQHCGFCDENQNESPQPLYGLGEIGIIGWLLIKGAKDEAWTSQRPDLGAMMEWNREPSPRSLARVAGLLQLLEAGTSTFGQVIVREKLFVSGNAAATAANVLGHEPLFWTGFAFSLIGVVFHIAWTLALYDLFKPVSRRVSLFAAFVMLVGCAIQAMSCLLCLV